MMKMFHRKKALRRGFSLIELMVSMGILSVLLLMMMKVLDTVQNSWIKAESRIEQFREARVAFDVVSKNLSQATMHTYWNLAVDNQNQVTRYEKTSDLHFVTLPADSLGHNVSNDKSFDLMGQALFFQAPLGASNKYRNLSNLFNGRGYFVGYGGDALYKPSFVKSAAKYRFRLIEFRPPAEDNLVFIDGQEERKAGGRQNFTKWFKQLGGNGRGGFERYLNPLAENIITLVVAPRDSIKSATGQGDTFSQIAPNYAFDSNEASPSFESFSQQVPPLVRVTMIALDETSAIRLSDGAKSAVPPVIVSALENRFTDTKRYDDDVIAVITALDKAKIAHKVFSTLVMLRSAKWSTFSLGGGGN